MCLSNIAYITSPRIHDWPPVCSLPLRSFTEPLRNDEESGNPGFIDSSITITAVATTAVASASTINKPSPLLLISHTYEPREKPRQQNLIYCYWQFLIDLLLCRLRRQCLVIASWNMWQSARKSRDETENAKLFLSGKLFSSILTDPCRKTRRNGYYRFNCRQDSTCQS